MFSADLFDTLDRGTVWSEVAAVTVAGDVGHPQGLTRWGDSWLVSTVFPDRRSGELLVVAADGTVTARLEMTDGCRYHPGGLDATTGTVLVAIAEYRPDSTTSVWQLTDSLEFKFAYRFDDHLGAVCVVGDGNAVAVSWGSRKLFRLAADGTVLAQRENPSKFVDYQDLQYVGEGRVLSTGVGALDTPYGRLQIGGYALWDACTLELLAETPVPAWMPSGRVATYNAAHTDVEGGSVRLHCLVDDTDAKIVTWQAAN